MIRMWLASVCVIGGISWAIIDACHQLWWSSLGILGTGVFAGGLFLKSELLEWSMEYPGVVFAVMSCSFLGMLIGGLGHFAFKSPLMVKGREQGLWSLEMAFLELMQSDASHPRPQAEQEQIQRGFASCALQPSRDAMTTTMGAAKLIYESPRLALVDRATGIGSTPPSPDVCLITYRQLRDVEPWAFKLAEAENPWIRQQH